MELQCTGQAPVPIETDPGDGFRAGVVTIDTCGVYILTMTLKRPRAPSPSFEAKTLIVIDPDRDRLEHYRVGRGLELNPESKISTIQAGDELPVSLALDGEAVAGSLTVTPEKGRVAYLECRPARPAVVQVSDPGKYLLTARIAGRSCSLVFHVPEAEDD